MSELRQSPEANCLRQELADVCVTQTTQLVYITIRVHIQTQKHPMATSCHNIPKINAEEVSNHGNGFPNTRFNSRPDSLPGPL